MTLTLATILDTSAAGPLRQALKQALGGAEPLLIDGSGVERAGLACLQVLAAAGSAAAQGGTVFRIDPAGPPLAAMIALAGLDTLVPLAGHDAPAAAMGHRVPVTA
jgi:chemotaxis protein CheX